MRKKKQLPKEDFSPEELILIERLRSYRVPAMVEEYKRQLEGPNSELLPFHERFSRIVNAEWSKRFNKKFNDKLKKASLRYTSYEAQIDYYTQLIKNHDGWQFVEVYTDEGIIYLMALNDTSYCM